MDYIKTNKESWNRRTEIHVGSKFYDVEGFLNGRSALTVTWTHSVSDVVNALVKAGIQIMQLNEYPYSPYNCFEGMIERGER